LPAGSYPMDVVSPLLIVPLLLEPTSRPNVSYV
jgi:hypothetical protein